MLSLEKPKKHLMEIYEHDKLCEVMVRGWGVQTPTDKKHAKL